MKSCAHISYSGWILLLGLFFDLILAQYAQAELPPTGSKIVLQTPHLTFNHIQEFALHEGAVYRRRKDLPADHADSQWQAIPLEDSEETNPPPITSIKADGANFMAKAGSTIHYKKVLKESRFAGHYSAKDIALTSAWAKQWYSFPLLRWGARLINRGDKHLQIPDGSRDWAMSHRGKYARYFDAVNGSKRWTFPMVTSGYAIPEDGVGIQLADPYIPGHFSVTIEGPNPDFRGVRIQVAASILFLFGFEGENHDEPALYWTLADFDTRGKNPILLGGILGGLFKGYRGDSSWHRIEFPPIELDRLDWNTLTIFQTEGEGNAAREIRIGTTLPGLEGGLPRRAYFKKRLMDENWEHIIMEENQWPSSLPNTRDEPNHPGDESPGEVHSTEKLERVPVDHLM